MRRTNRYGRRALRFNALPCPGLALNDGGTGHLHIPDEFFLYEGMTYAATINLIFNREPST